LFDVWMNYVEMVMHMFDHLLMDVAEEMILMEMMHNQNFEEEIYDLMRKIV